MNSTLDNTFGKLTSARGNTIINNIYDYVLLVLQGLSFGKDENENTITERFCIELNVRKPYELPFYFHHQKIEDSKAGTSTDFAVFETLPFAELESVYHSIMKFEAKRLTSKLEKKREKEYVVGEYKDGIRIKNSGGIERFKNERHGKDVDYAVIIGYIQCETHEYWLEKVNGWIGDQIIESSDKDLLWEEEDLLVNDLFKESVSCYTSVSLRKSGNYIRLRHLWAEALNREYLT